MDETNCEQKNASVRYSPLTCGGPDASLANILVGMAQGRQRINKFARLTKVVCQLWRCARCAGVPGVQVCRCFKCVKIKQNHVQAFCY